jgi:cystathionine gamma-synthase
VSTAGDRPGDDQPAGGHRPSERRAPRSPERGQAFVPPERPLDPATLAVHLGRPPAAPGAAVNPPVAMSSTFRLGGATEYGREDNPTWNALEAAIGGLEGGRALVFASGMGAVSAVFETLPTPGRVAVAGDAYTGTRSYLADVAGRGRLRFRTVDVADTEATLRVCAELVEGPARPSGVRGQFGSGGLLWLESPTNPLLAVADLDAVITGAHELGMDVAVDNTFATPLLQRPLAFGADVVVHSGTKYIAGHSDVLLGLAVTSRTEVYELLRTRRTLHGGVAGSWDTWLALRGLRTLAVRLERAERNAGELARRLASHPRVERVHYPGLPSDPGHERARAQMAGFGAVVSFEVGGGVAGADAVVTALSLITPGTSLGGVESLLERRARYPGEQAIPPALLRLSVGIEHVEDLWDDLEAALTASF